ncbi:3455_t:CDS:2 [Funneliformis mosseae]|uniref:3455_t:CDS:1 n=1 Tax=Funneliformis mosseae TaxID=27381 RepID=A0A9N8ZED3_FUNMO|nr:3455_t:CDS:2 [Funneliformis mosseae]
MYNITRGQVDHDINNYSKYQKLNCLIHQAFEYMVVNDRQYVSINWIHINNQASFWECLRYFEDLSALDPYAKSNLSMSEDNDNGYSQTGSIFETILDRKTGALKMVALYKGENKLEELLNEIKIYIGPLKDIQGIYIPRLLKFGVLYETFVFVLTSLAEETFANMGDNITRKEKQLAIKGLQELHSKGVMHRDIRLENIMVKRMNEDSTSCVWWIDFGWSKMTDNVKDLDKELTKLKYLLGMVNTI